MPTVSTQPGIIRQPNARRKWPIVGGTLLADTSHAIELRGRGYPLRQYIPCEDVRMGLLKPYKTETHCPFKVGAAQFSFCQHTDMA